MTTIKFDNTNGTDIDAYNKFTKEFREWKGMGEIVVRKPTRTPKESGSMYKMFGEMEGAFDDKHIYYNQQFIDMCLKNTFEIKISSQMIKSMFWDNIMMTVTGKKSTTVLTTSEFSEISKVFIDFWATKGVHVTFPNEQDKQLGTVIVRIDEAIWGEFKSNKQ